MAREEKLTDIPDNEVERIMKNYERIGAKPTKTRQNNGKWTVMAIIPD